MVEKTALAPAHSAKKSQALRPRSTGMLKRIQHLLWGGAIAFVMLAVMLLEPIDQFSWLLQSRIADKHPSGDIVFVGAGGVENTSRSSEREKLAAALRSMEARGVGKIYLDFVLKEGENSAADQDLAKAIQSLGPRIALVDQIELNIDGSGETYERSDAAFVSTGGRVVSDRTDSWFGYTWQYNLDHYALGNTSFFPASLAGTRTTANSKLIVDYGFHPDLIPTADLDDFAQNKPLDTDISGKTVVIGPGASLTDLSMKVPGRYSAPPSYIAIYAAETLKSGRNGFVGAMPIFLFFMTALAILILSNPSRPVRRAAYLGVVLALPIILYAGAKLGVRVELSYVGVLLITYGILRSRARWRMRLANVDSETGLPKLRLLEQLIAKADIPRGHIIVARLHGFERVLKTLGSAQRAKYVHRLVDRLRAADSELTIYIDGHNLAWETDENRADVLIEHLAGLRAIFAAPIQIGDESVDVGITFGVASLVDAGRDAVAAAAAAAEDTSEAHDPIHFAKVADRHDELWDISLRARIDDAMEAGEIYCVYQPKVDMIAGEMTGVEALVRWHDPDRGFISPMKFIAQCEKAGRMEHLTRYVLQTACNAGRLLHFRGSQLSMAVNISATLLGDMRIVGLVRDTIQATGYDPRYLVLEITETSRIGNLETAAAILNELKSLGLRISIDDFGVGAANFEALYELPFDELKIDRLFVDSISTSAKARAIASSMVAMGAASRITVIAEGAEDEKTLQILNEIGCRYVQGYALARPLSLTNLLTYKVSLAESKTGT
ncbi:GGDEF domain-containing phosphodiesterase [Qipengyuania psychrotolerans]|uniref:EAL domain-containing protein n=1 Tax=Qipengyuania psychrotolerans TaxID=2867238 RepID=A0ABX8ZK30_9SPHN|nr:EAL domain-containing protein [Qipengyuania psychrotolerans]QZD87543.1 EAL domain-containing protein [Qipengyuania psychrotolerans]